MGKRIKCEVLLLEQIKCRTHCWCRPMGQRRKHRQTDGVAIEKKDKRKGRMSRQGEWSVEGKISPEAVRRGISQRGDKQILKLNKMTKFKNKECREAWLSNGWRMNMTLSMWVILKESCSIRRSVSPVFKHTKKKSGTEKIKPVDQGVIWVKSMRCHDVLGGPMGYFLYMVFHLFYILL